MDKLANFKILLSKERLESYNNEIDKHYENLKLIANITPKIATLEIILRNKLDSVLSLRNNEWIKNAKDAKIIEAREKIENNSNGSCLSHHQYLSRMSLGTIIHITRKGRFQNKVMNLGDISFLDYDSSNRNFWIKDSRKTYFKNFEKVDIVLSLLQNLRNRSYHWENITKTISKNGIDYPRLTTKVKNTHIGINPNKIEIFLDDLIKTYDERFLDYC